MPDATFGSSELMGEPTAIPTGSKRYTLSKHDGWEMVKVLAYSGGSAMITTLLSLLNFVDIPPQYAAIGGLSLSIVNILLVAAKRFFQDRSAVLEKF